MFGSENACVLKQSAKCQFKVIQGHWFWYQSKRVCNFLSVVNSNFGPILPHFRDTVGFLLRRATRPHPYSTRILGCSPWTRLPMLWLQGANYFRTNLTCAHGTYINVMDRWTDRQTDRRLTIAILRNAHRPSASRGKNPHVYLFYCNKLL